MNKKRIEERKQRESMLRKMIGVKDFSKNGVCSKCGYCCGHLLHLSFKERFAIMEYVIQNNISPYEKHIDPKVEGASCPYRDKEKCLIYEVRPAICKNFYCYNLSEMIKMKTEIEKQNLQLVDMWEFARGIENIKKEMKG